MRWSDVSFDPSPKTLRQFAGLWLVFFGGLAAWQGLVRANTTLALVFAALAITLGPLGLVRPRALKWVFVTWMVLAFPIGWTISTVILTLMFFGLFTPVALFFRLIGRDALRLRPRPEAATYWVDKPAAADVRNYFRQS